MDTDDEQVDEAAAILVSLKRPTRALLHRDVLLEWVEDNASAPYPSLEEKIRLHMATRLSIKQIDNFMSNARRRQLKRRRFVRPRKCSMLLV